MTTRAVVLMLVGLLFLCAVLPVAGILETSSLDQARDEWASFKQRFDKGYSTPEEENERFLIFAQKLRELPERQKRVGPRVKLGINKFSDLTHDEFRRLYLHPIGPARQKKTTTRIPDDLPQTWDWVQKGAVTPVKNEGQCGATWAMSAVDVLESVCKIAGYPLTVLSTQQIMDCDTNDQGCNGGFPEGAYQYLLTAGGIESESSYPYNTEDQTCTANPKLFVPCKMRSYRNVSVGTDEASLIQWVYTKSPIVVCIDAGQTAFVDYTSGVLTAQDCPGTELDHCLALVGWDWINGERVWRLKNQWGPDWGEGGYVWFQMGTNTCGMDSPYIVAPCVGNVC